jgi:hypothetical protein
MSTFGQLVDRVLGHLRSEVRDQEQSTHLTAGINASDLSITVADATRVGGGRIQIGDEVIWVDSADRGTNVLTIPPYGRGMDGTTAASHSSGERVIVAPLYPRQTVKDEINQAIKTIGAYLYAVDTTDITPSSTSYIYDVPADVDRILNVKAVDPRAGGEVFYLRKFSLDEHAPSSLSATGKTIAILDASFLPPTTIMVTYSKKPTALSANSDDWSVTGLPDTAQDLPVLLAASRLLATADAYTIQTRAVEANAMAAKTPNGATSLSKYLYQLYAQRLDEERVNLLNSVANRSYYSR